MDFEFVRTGLSAVTRHELWLGVQLPLITRFRAAGTLPIIQDEFDPMHTTRVSFHERRRFMVQQGKKNRANQSHVSGSSSAS